MRHRTALAVLLCCAALSGGSAETPVFRVTPQPLVEKPVSPLLAGHFVELGYGFQVEPMMAEMFFNRSFEPYMPYRENSFTWFGLWRDDRDHGKGYETDWTRMHWYHSGYQHNQWFAAPGVELPFRIDQASTFFELRTPLRKVELQLSRDTADVRHGIQALRVMNREAAEWAGLAQSGKYLRKGESYIFRGVMKSGGRPVKAEVRFYPKESWDRPIAVLPLETIGPEYGTRSVVFRNTDYQGWATFSLWIPPGASITVDDFSLLPASNFHGWREDVVDAIRGLKPGVFRFPGGCFASFYNWRDGVGPLSARPPQPSYFWGGMNYNDLGTDEFAAMCKRVGAEMMFAVNVYHPAKKDYLLKKPNPLPAGATHSFDMSRFTDVRKGAAEAAAWVAYCNLPAGKHASAGLRAKNGYPQPWGVKYWELDNETFRWLDTDEYIEAARLYSKAMKAVDPTIKTGIVIYNRDRDEVLPRLLEGVGRDVDFLADRNDAEAGLDKVLRTMREFNARAGTRLFYTNTEWLPRDTSDLTNQYNSVRDRSRAAFFERMSRWNVGLLVAKTMLSWQRRGGDVAWVNFNNLSNTHAQSAVETPKEGVFFTACGIALKMIAHSPAAWPLSIEGYAPKVADEFQVQAAWDRDRKRLVLYVVNRTAAARDAVFDLAKLGREFRGAAITVAAAPGPDARNTPAAPDTIQIRTHRDRSLRVRGRYTIAAAPWSFTEVVLAEI
jgi:alpha-L-arabinofuranosidase